MMFCRNCGNQLPDGAKFCNRCGAVQESVNTNNTNPQSASQHQSQGAGTQPSAARKPVKSKSGVGVGIILIIVAVIICLIQLNSGKPTQDTSGGSTYSGVTKPQGLDRDEEFYPFYAELDDTEKVTYEEILSGIKAGSSKIYLSKSDELYMATEVEQIAIKISYEHPEVFWFDGTVTCYANDYHHIVYVTPDYNNLINDLENNKNAVESVVSRLLSETAGMSDVEAEKYFLDYLCNNVTYVKGEYDQTIYSTFVQEETVCSGYAHGLQYLMMRRDVPCYFATGWAFNFHTQETGRHAWNIIKLDGSFYNCDVTFSDKALEENQFPSYISYEFFNVTDSELTDGNHGRDTYGMLLPSCTADNLSYNALYGEDWEYTIMSDCPGKMVTTLDEFYNLLYDRLVTYGSGVHDFTFVMTMDAYYQVESSGSNEKFSESVVYPAVEVLGFGNWSNSIWSADYYGLDGDDYLFVDMHLELT